MCKLCTHIFESDRIHISDGDPAICHWSMICRNAGNGILGVAVVFYDAFGDLKLQKISHHTLVISYTQVASSGD